MPNSAETIEKLSRQLERLIIIEMAQGCSSLEELIEKLKAMVNADR